MPDTQISEDTLDIAARAVYAVSVQEIEPALGIPMCKFEELPERDLNLHRDYAKAALQAALSGHVVGWRTNLADWIDYADKLEAALKLVAGFSDDELKRIQAQDGLTIVRPEMEQG